MSASTLAFTIVLALSLTSCATTQEAQRPTAERSTSEAAPTTEASTATLYYSGQVAVTSPDGSQAFGPPRPGLVKRTIDRDTGVITEVVLDEGALRTTTLTRRGDTSVFDATADDSSFTGTVTMVGSDWPFEGWTYDLQMADGSGKIEGTATLTSDHLSTEKFFVSPDGARRARIVDELHVVSRDEFESQLPAQ